MLEKSCTHANWYQALLHVHVFGAFRVFEVTADRRKEEYRKPEKKKKGKVVFFLQCFMKQPQTQCV